MAALLDRYVASPRYDQKSQRTQQRTGIGQIERHLKPLLGKRHVARLEQDDIRRAFAAIRDGKTAATNQDRAARTGACHGRRGRCPVCLSTAAGGLRLGRGRTADRSQPDHRCRFRQRRRARGGARRGRLCAPVRNAGDDGSRAPPAAGRGRRHPHHCDDRRTARRDYRPALAACETEGRPHRPASRPGTKPAARPASRA